MSNPFCECCKTRRDMVARHGTRDDFRSACMKSLGEISLSEANATISRYRRQWAMLPDTEGHDDGDCVNLESLAVGTAVRCLKREGYTLEQAIELLRFGWEIIHRERKHEVPDA